MLLFPLLSIAISALGMPLWTAMVPPNRFYGVRTKATLADESVWYAANRAAGRDAVLLGALTLAFSVALSEFEVGGSAYVLAMAFALAAGLALIAWIALTRARHL